MAVLFGTPGILKSKFGFLIFQVIKKICIKGVGWSIFPLFLALVFKQLYSGRKYVASICTFDRAPQTGVGVTFPQTQLSANPVVTVGND